MFKAQLNQTENLYDIVAAGRKVVITTKPIYGRRDANRVAFLSLARSAPATGLPRREREREDTGIIN